MRQRPRPSGQQTAALIAAAVFICALGVTVWRERFELPSFLLTALSLAVLVQSAGWWRTRRVLAATLALNVGLISLFLWSLDEREHIVIRVDRGEYVASVDGGAPISAPRAQTGSGMGLYAGGLDSYRVTPTGEAQTPPASSPLARFGEWMRSMLQPAWSHVYLIGGTSSARDLLTALPAVDSAAGWSFDRRGEYVGALGAVTSLGAAPPDTYTIEADLMRGDGTQGLLVGLDSANRGYFLAVRTDQPDLIWNRWNAGPTTAGISGTSARLPLVPMIQRNVRLLLAGAMVALVLLLATIPLYLVLLAFFHFVGGKSEDDLQTLRRMVENDRLSAAAALCLAAAAGVAAALIASALLERIPHVQDSVADLFQAKTLALGRLWVPDPPLHSFFSEEFIPVHDGRWFGKYPPGWPLLLAIGVLLHVPWLVDPVLAGADVLLIYLIGREVYGPAIGAIAAALALSSPFLLFLGGSFMPHTSTLFYLSAATYVFIRWWKREHGVPGRGDWRLLVPAGFLYGMGFITRQLDAVTFTLPFLALLVPRLVRRDLRPLLLLAAGGAGPVLCFLLYNWDLTGNPLTSPYSLWWPFDRVGFGSTIGMGGFTPAQGLWNTSFNLQMLLAHLFGWPFYTTLTLIAIPFLAGRATIWDAIFLACGLAIVAVYVAYWNPGVMYGPRYYYVAIPSFALLSARGLEELYRWALRLPLGRRHDPLAALCVPIIVAALLLAHDLTVYLPAQIPIYRGYNYTSAASVNAVERAGIHHALVFVVSNPPGQWWSYGAVFSSNSPLLDGDIVYARDLGPANPSLMRLYRGREFYRLDGTALTPLRP